MNNYFDHNEDFSKAFRILDKRYIGVWSFIGFPEPAPAPAPVPVAPPSSTPSVFVPDLSGLPTSGAISLNDIQDEFGGTNPISISEYYGAASGVPSSGAIDLSDFYGKAGSLPPVSLGYFIGGRATPSTDSNQYQRIQYSNDTLSIRPATLSTGTQSHSIVENTTYGYICGGFKTNNIDRFQFSNETSSNPPVDLPGARYGGSRGISSPTKGFVCGGGDPFNPPSIPLYDDIREINLSNGTLSTPPTTLSRTTAGAAKLNTKGAGYICLGSGPPTLGSTNEPSVSKLRFSDETVSAIFATALPGNPTPADSFTNRSGGKGYIYGGFKIGAYTGPSFYSTVIERLQYSTDTFSVLPTSNNVNGRGNVGLFSDSSGYIAGANIPSNSYSQYRDVFNKLSFSTETFITSTSSFAPTCYPDMASTQI